MEGEREGGREGGKEGGREHEEGVQPTTLFHTGTLKLHIRPARRRRRAGVQLLSASPRGTMRSNSRAWSWRRRGWLSERSEEAVAVLWAMVEAKADPHQRSPAVQSNVLSRNHTISQEKAQSSSLECHYGSPYNVLGTDAKQIASKNTFCP